MAVADPSGPEARSGVGGGAIVDGVKIWGKLLARAQHVQGDGRILDSVADISNDCLSIGLCFATQDRHGEFLPWLRSHTEAGLARDRQGLLRCADTLGGELSELRRPWLVTAALALSALMGVAMPLGDAANAAADDIPAAPPVAEPEPAEETEQGDAPVLNDTAESKPKAKGTSTSYALSWTVVDSSGELTPGATVTLDGPRVAGSGSAAWGSSRVVNDCTQAPCASTSMDQDPRPGVFEVDRLVTRGAVAPLTESVVRQRFRIVPKQAPDGYAWAEKSEKVVPALSPNQQVQPAPTAWASTTYDFGALRVDKPRLSCDADNIYSMSPGGQMKRIQVDAGRTTGQVSNVGGLGPGPGVVHYNGLAVGNQGEDVYSFNRLSNSTRIAKYDVGSGAWQYAGMAIDVQTSAISLIAGSMDPQNTYWVGGFFGSSGFDLWAMNPERTKMERRGRVDLSEWASSNANGDFAFDGQGNLYIVRGLNTGFDLDVFRIDAADLAAGRGTEPVPVSARIPTTQSPFGAVSGIAYDQRGALFIGGKEGIAVVTLPVSPNVPKPLTLRGALLDTTDLATCGFPPTVELHKDLPDGRAVAGDQFELELTSNGVSIGTAETAGASSGVQADTVGPVPATSGANITLTESPVGATLLGNYASNWECVANGNRIAGGPGQTGTFTVPNLPNGGEILCTIKNSVASAEKSASPESGTPLSAGEIVNYELTIDNTRGEGPVEVDYWDALGDVLDDAVFVDAAGNPTTTGAPAVTTSGGVVYTPAKDWDPEKGLLRMRGTVAAAGTGTLSFSVKVRPNAEDAEARQQATSSQGYLLRNKLVRGTGTDVPPALPSECEPGLCTEHPVNAWTVEKGSVPADGETLAKGGNVHYKVTAEKINAATVLSGLVLEDDLTHVFKSAGWAPEAAPPAGALSSGTYLFNESGRSIGLDGKPNTGSADQYGPVQAVSEPEERNVATAGSPPDNRWILSSGPPLTLPTEAVRAEMWFAVQAAESPAGIPDPNQWLEPGNNPVTGWTFVNYATGMAGNDAGAFAPNQCITGEDIPDTAPAADAGKPADTEFPGRCQVQQQLSQNSFTIRKDAGGLGVAGLTGDPAWGSDPAGLWNMVGQEFEIRDSVDGGPSASPSVQLCRTDYDPQRGWDGKWIPQADAGDASRWDFATQTSQTQQRILEWNNANPGDQRPLCGTISAVDAGPQPGQWRSEGLGAGEFWLVETKAPNAQLNLATLETRPVPGVQKLAEAIPFTVWPTAAPEAGSGAQSRGQLDIGHGASSLSERCDASASVAERPLACVDRPGYVMVVQDPTPTPLPLTGGQWLAWLASFGVLVLLSAVAASTWWRRRSSNDPRHAT